MTRGEPVDSRSPPVATAGRSDVDSWRRLESMFARFEQAWQAGPPRWEDFLESPDVPSNDRALLARELVKIDLDYRWRTATIGAASRFSIQTTPVPSRFDDMPLRPTLEAYCERTLELPSLDKMPIDLASEEYRVRKRYGDSPRVAEYAARFPHLADELPDVLRAVDRDLAAETRELPASKRRKLGRYELIERIGQGSFGVVWKAWDPQLRREVAVKLPRGGAWLTADAERRFVREACATARLAHEGIVSVHDVGRDQDTLFLVAELVPGTTLSEWLEKNRPAPEQSIEIVARLAEALDFAHRAGIVHRDVKPSNVMLDARSRRDELGAASSVAGPRGVELPFRPRVMDFGLAKREAGDTTMTRDGHLLGTPAYMSPEQFRDPHAVDGRSDVYSLGVILYQLLTGKPPFQGETHTVLAMVQTTVPQAPRKLVDRLPGGVDAIVMKCLAKRPDDRYWTAGELADDLRRSLANETIRAGADRSFSHYVRRTIASPWAAVFLPALAILAAAGGWSIAGRFAPRNVVVAPNERPPGDPPPNTPDDGTFASLRSDAIDESERRADMPGELVAVVGESRQRHWAPAERVIHLPRQDLIVTASSDGDVHLWRHDVEANRLHEEDAFWAHDGVIAGLVSLDDGRIVATGGEDGVTRLWELSANPRVAWEVIRGDAHDDEQPEPVIALAAAPGAMRLAIVGPRGATVWDVSGPARRIASIPASEAIAAAFVGQDKLLLAQPREIGLWELQAEGQASTAATHQFVAIRQSDDDDERFAEDDEREEPEDSDAMDERSEDEPENHEDDSSRPELSLEGCVRLKVWRNPGGDWRDFSARPDGSLFAVGGDDGFVCVWSIDDAEDARPRHRFEPESASCLAFGDSPAELLVGTTDGQTKAWNLAGREPRQTLFVADVHAGEIHALTPGDQGRFVYTVGADQTLRALDRSTSKATPLDGHVGPMNHARFLGAECRSLATWSTADHALRLWTVDQGRLVETAKIENAADPLRVAPVQGDGFALAQTKGYVSLWSPDGTSLRKTFSRQLPNLLAIAPQADGERVVLATAAGEIVVWTPATGEEHVVRPAADEGDAFHAVALSRDGTTATLLRPGGSLVVSRCDPNVAEDDRERTLLDSDQGAVSSPTVSDDGTRVAAVVDGSTARIWNVEDGSPVGEPIAAAAAIAAMAFSPDGATLVLVQADGGVRWIDATTGKSLGEGAGRHGDKPTLRFAPDGALLAIADSEGGATLWNVKKARMVRQWRFDGAILDLAFSPDGRHLTTSNANGTAYVLRLPGG